MLKLAQPLHHAYGIAGEAEGIVPKLLSALKKSTGFNAQGNPDFRSESFEVMGIDEARALKESAERKAVTGGKKVFIVSARGITKEAQNALLKVFEEPPVDTHFFLIVPSMEILLPTLRSRLFALSTPKVKGTEASFQAETFLHASTPARLKTIQGLLKSADEEVGKRTLVAFLDEIERTVADTRGLKTQIHADTQRAQALSDILEVKKYSRDRAPSFKLLLEHLALVVPRF